MSKGIVLKNFVAIKKSYRGFVVYELIDKEGIEFVPFSIFQRDFIDNSHSASTLKIARIAVAKFIDYLAELDCFGTNYNAKHIRFIVNQYPDFLADNIDSDNELMKSVQESLREFKPKLNSISSHKSHIIYVNAYLELSEKFAREAAEVLAAKTGVSANDSYDALFPKVWKLQKLTQKEKTKFAQTKIGGCIRDSGKFALKPSKVLSVLGRAGKGVPVSEVDRAFPVQKLENLIGHINSKRNKAIFAVLGCLGIRMSEAMQMRWSDIDFKNREICIRPATKEELERANIPKEKFNNILPWKGRKTSDSMPIAELEQLMFDCLYEYQLSKEFKSSPHHDFIFVYTKGEKAGQPLLQIVDVENNSVSVLIAPFKQACERAGINPPHHTSYLVYSPHDLRHGYGTYMRNDAPRLVKIIDAGVEKSIIKYGFSLADVSKFMGHSNLEATEVYSKKSLLSLKSSHVEANAILASGGHKQTQIIALATYHTKMRNHIISQIESPQERAEVMKLIEGSVHD